MSACTEREPSFFRGDGERGVGGDLDSRAVGGDLPVARMLTEGYERRDLTTVGIRDFQVLCLVSSMMDKSGRGWRPVGPSGGILAAEQATNVWTALRISRPSHSYYIQTIFNKTL
jgi:hypothetical protein